MAGDTGHAGSAGATAGKDVLIALAFHASRLFLRQPLFHERKIAVWDKFVRPYVTWRPNTYWTTTRFGGRFECSLKDAIQQRILYFGVWEPNLTGFLSSRLKPGDLFVDVGANIGYFSVLASRLVGAEGRVIAFEASPRIFQTLCRHSAVNGCGNIRLENMAIAGEKGTLRLFAGPDWNSGATSTLASRGEGFECAVPADRLDAVLSEEDRRRVRMIKIDVEGAEAPILRSLIAQADAYSAECEIVAEISPEECEQFGETAGGLIEDFERVGFHAYRLDNDYTAAAYLRRTPPLRPRRLREVPDVMTDVVFSRVDADAL